MTTQRTRIALLIAIVTFALCGNCTAQTLKLVGKPGIRPQTSTTTERLTGTLRGALLGPMGVIPLIKTRDSA